MFGNSGGRAVPKKGAGEEIIVAIDLGSTKLRVIAGRVSPDSTVEILGYRVGESVGISKGAVTDIARLSNELSGLLQKFVENFNATAFTVGVAGSFIVSCNERGTSTVQTGVVSYSDRYRAIENARAGIKTFSENDYDIIHIVPQNYLTETSSEILNPVGQYAKKLDVNVHIIGCRKAHVMNLKRVIANVAPQFFIRSVAFSGIASADAVLTEGEKEIGVCLIDLGGGTVNVAVYDNKKLIYTFGFHEGGEYITQAIAKEFGIPIKQAEFIKVQYGVADSRYLTEEQYTQSVEVPLTDPYSGGITAQIVPLAQLANTINSCLTQIFRAIYDQIMQFVSANRSHDGLSLGAGYVLTGGVAQTPFIEAVVNSDMNGPSGYVQGSANFKIRIGRPRGIKTEKADRLESLTQPDMAVAVGLLRTAHLSELSEAENTAEDGKQDKSLITKFKDWFSREF
ncbi:MAG: cell division protein FtsA [Succinivibrio sp.]|nr:cell division protein FtsA [Succinivibrio sp.]